MTLSVLTVTGTTFSGVDNSFDPFQYPVGVALNLLPSPWQLLADDLAGLQYPPLINWVPIDYIANLYPMGASVDDAVQKLVTAINNTPGPLALVGYSQGSIPVSRIWRDYILSGPLNHRLGDIKAAVNWGNPMRCSGIANGNAAAGLAIPSGGGISGDNLTAAQTPSWWFDYANPNDLYTDCPVGTRAGDDETLIYKLIVTTSFGGTLAGLLKIVEALIGQFNSPLTELIGIVTAIWNGLQFVVAGPNAGHYTYDIGPAITYLRSVALQFA